MTLPPSVILIFSGKRKSGKDYITERLHKRFTGQSCILRLSGPLKEEYAKAHALDFEKLLSDSDYKENYRADMIAWGEAKRTQNPGFFCEAAIAAYVPTPKPDSEPGHASGSSKCKVWIVSDARRRSDLHFFTANYPGRCIAVRVHASEHTRAQRGYTFTPGVDDAESECGLDEAQFDVVLDNDGVDAQGLDAQLDALYVQVEKRLCE